MAHDYFGWATRSLAGAAATLLLLGATPPVAARAADDLPTEQAPVDSAVEAPEPAAADAVTAAEPAPLTEEPSAPEPEQPAAPGEATKADPPAVPQDAPEQIPPPEVPEEEPAPEVEPEPAPEVEPVKAPEEGPEKSPAPKPKKEPEKSPKQEPEKAPREEPEKSPAPQPKKEPEKSPAPKPKKEPEKSPAPAPLTPSRSETPKPSSRPSPAPSTPRAGGGSAGSIPWSGPLRPAFSTEWPGFLALSGMEPSQYALDDIPAEMLDLYQAATLMCPGLPWTVLAGVGKVETGHGRNVAVSSAGARGPMQFLPSTWATYGLDGNGDGRAVIDDPEDAVYSAAAYLCAHGGGDVETLPEALYAYNRAWWYVERVLRFADRYRVGSPEDVLPARMGREALLDNPRLIVYPGGRADIAQHRIDPRVLDLLALLTQQHEITVVALETGHSKYIAGTNRVSNHFHGRAVDIAAIDGEPVSSSSPRARALVLWLASLDVPERPSEVGSPFADLASEPGHFSNAAHMGHVHVGWGPRPRD